MLLRRVSLEVLHLHSEAPRKRILVDAPTKILLASWIVSGNLHDPNRIKHDVNVVFVPDRCKYFFVHSKRRSTVVIELDRVRQRKSYLADLF
jgi:hypothetical protein